ncbi:MAG: IS110 family transposase [Magnetospirillum sp.]|nr:MAG: IS110 family transposase [Magnetospirillum sp.]
MEVLHPHCAGLDVHKDTVMACVRPMAGGTVKREVTTFKTTAKDPMALSEWLAAEGCTHIAMEAAGIYWKPVWHVLSDGDFELVLANAAHVKTVPGRKTDVNDATWLADLMAHGLIRGSFVADEQTQEMRDFLRTRKQPVRERSSHIQRLQKTLEDANIKLDSAVSDIMGLSGRVMVEALIAGETDPAALACLAHRRIKAPRDELCEALRGRVTKHHRFMLQLHLQQIDALDAAIARIDQEVDANVEPFRQAVNILSSIPGISELSAQVILAEIGTDMSRFPTDGHLKSWAGLCPRNDESAGKRRSNRMRKGAPRLKTTLIQCAWAAARTKGSHLQAQFHRLRSRRGAKKAIGAVAASILAAAYHMLKDGTCYDDLGHDYFDQRAKAVQTNRLIVRLQNLGYTVEITPVAA